MPSPQIDPAPFLSPGWLRDRERQVLALILVLALFHGFLYIYIVPPWQHYDEPTHFEYAWLIANTGQLPEPEQYDWDFRADLVRSMIAHDFYDGMEKPDLANLTALPPGLQFPQLDDPPAYYLLASLPLRLLKTADLADQVLAARQVSLILLVITILAAWGTLKEMTTPESAWRFLVPLTMALLPGFVDLMTSVNNDVGAVAIFSLFLWGSVRLIQRGPQLSSILWVFVAAAVAFFTKSTAFAAVPLALVALMLSILPGRLRRVAWGVILGGGLLGVLALMYLEEPAYWYRATSQAPAIRAARPEAPLGDYVLQINSLSAITPDWLRPVSQPIPFEVGSTLAGKSLTVGFWLWANPQRMTEPTLEAQSPTINTDTQSLSIPVTITGEPQFFAFNLRLPADTIRLWLTLAPMGRNPNLAQTYYLDGLMVAEGDFPLDAIPEFSTPDGADGTWGGQPFQNLLRNGSGEQAWPAFRPWADNQAARVLPNNIRPSMLLYTLLDPTGAGFYYQSTGDYIFETFWGRFGWGHVPLPSPDNAYRVLAALSILGVLGVVLYPYGRSTSLPADVLLFFALALLAAWGGALARGSIYIFVQHIFIPSARYGLPAIIPTVLFFVAGWFGLAGYVLRRVRIPPAVVYGVYVVSLLAFDAISLWGIQRFYG